jgi:hypothetical protein
MAKSTIPMQPVTSSQLAEVGYDAATKRLAVRFKSKTPRFVYEYANVTPELAEALRKADDEPDMSVGRFFGEHIKGKPDAYPFTKLDELEDEQEKQA